MPLANAVHQKSGKPERAERGSGEAWPGNGRGEAGAARHERTSLGAGDLLEQALSRENMRQAWKRIKANKGSAGVDGRTVQETGEYLRWAWPDIRQQLLNGTYRPAPVRRVNNPKPGGGQRQLGIPTALDRLIQQALLQVLQPLIDPSFSEHSHGFRPGRSAAGAVMQAKRYVEQGHSVVVDVDLEKFFDRVNHDILMDRIAKRIGDKAVLRLIRLYLQAGMLADGVSIERHEGTPQGGPLSPLLANVLLDEVDRKLEARGHKFVRYADDCNVYVKSRKAGQRVLAWLRRSYAKLKLKVNEAKTAVASVWGRKFLGYCFWPKGQSQARPAAAPQALQTLRARIRELTRRNGGKSLQQIVQDLKGYIPGWKAYFRLADTPGVMRELDEWLRHRLRAIQLRQWKCGPTIFRELRALGASVEVAARTAMLGKRWWRTAGGELNRVLTVAYFDRLGVPRFS